MHDHATGAVGSVHADISATVAANRLGPSGEQEAHEAAALAPGATRAEGAGHRGRREEPDSERTCFERDSWTGSCYVVDGPGLITAEVSAH
jgi:dGTPase